MSTARRLVLDANILLRGIFGVRVRSLLEAYENVVDFYAPDVCFEDARRYVSDISVRRNLDPADSLLVLDGLVGVVAAVDASLYDEFERPARDRIASRDEDDWPVIATALLLNAPIWTEDQDFFGTGVATWTTANIEQFLRDL